MASKDPNQLPSLPDGWSKHFLRREGMRKSTSSAEVNNYSKLNSPLCQKSLSKSSKYDVSNYKTRYSNYENEKRLTYDPPKPTSKSVLTNNQKVKNSESKPFSQCPICGASITNVPSHIKAVHSKHRDNHKYLPPCPKLASKTKGSKSNLKPTAERSQGVPLNESNIGFKMLLKAGWDGVSGLGRNGHGRRSPVKTVVKNDRKGLGIGDKKHMKNNHFVSKDKKSFASTNTFVHAIQKQKYQEAFRALQCNKRSVREPNRFGRKQK